MELNCLIWFSITNSMCNLIFHLLMTFFMKKYWLYTQKNVILHLHQIYIILITVYMSKVNKNNLKIGSFPPTGQTANYLDNKTCRNKPTWSIQAWSKNQVLSMNLVVVLPNKVMNGYFNQELFISTVCLPFFFLKV